MTPNCGEKEVLKVRLLRSKGSVIAVLVLAAALVFGVTLVMADPPAPSTSLPPIPLPIPEPGD